MLVEDHKLFAEAIQRVLSQQAGLEIVEVVESGEKALKRLPELKVDLVLVDVSLPGMDGIDLVQRIHSDLPHLRCLMLSGHTNSQYVKRALEAGAYGYVLKDDVKGILEGIQQVLGGEIYLSRVLRRNGLGE